MGLANYINLKNIICSLLGQYKALGGSKLHLLGLYNYLDPWFYTLHKVQEHVLFSNGLMSQC